MSSTAAADDQEILKMVKKNEVRKLEKFLEENSTSLKTVKDYRDFLGRSLIMIAASKNCCGMVMFLLKLNVDVNARSKSGQTALMTAAGHGFLDIVTMLLEESEHHGCALDYRSVDGWSAFFFCVLNGHLAVVEYLLSMGSDINLQDEQGQTPLMIAAYAGSEEVVELLIENKASVNLRSSYGYTAMMRASEMGHVGCMELLLNAGADLHLEARNKKTALELAINRDQKESIGFLILHGATPIAPKEFPVFVSSDGNNGDETSPKAMGIPKDKSSTPYGIADLAAFTEDAAATHQKENRRESSIMPVSLSPIVLGSSKGLSNDSGDKSGKDSFSQICYGESLDGQSLF